MRVYKFALLVSVAGLFNFLPASARADIEAVTAAQLDYPGWGYGGFGFSFTPTTNLEVTRVGYLNYDATNPIISFWSDTNYVIASFPIVPPSGNGVTAHTNVALTLLAGRRYSITLQDPDASGQIVLVQASDMGHFTVATQLMDYVSAGVDTAGQFYNFSPDVLYLGPSFTFNVSTSELSAPWLDIQLSNDTAIVSWPDSPGFVLQENSELATVNWMLVTNAVSVVGGTNQVNISPVTGNEFFRLIHP